MLRKLIFLVVFLLLVVAVSLSFLPGVRKILTDASLVKKATALIKSSDQDLHAKANPDMTGGSPVSAVEPGIEKIKIDLIGRSVPGWTFDKITEFNKAAITSIARTDDAVEFRIDLVMLPYNAKSETTYNLQLISTYLHSETGWSFSRVEELQLSFNLMIPAGKSVKVNSLPDCKLLPDDKNRLFWTCGTWDYEILSGPGYGGISLPAAASYDVRSKAKQTIMTKITFRPNSAPD